MLLTKTQAEILKLFASSVADKRSIKGVAEALKKPYPLIHRSVKGLLENGLLKKDEHELISLDTSQYGVLSYIESLRSEEFLRKRKTLALLAKDIMESVEEDFFVFLIFGSAVIKDNPRDIDMFFVVQDDEKRKKVESAAERCASRLPVKADISVVTKESVYEMLRMKQPNTMSETLSKHIIIYGAEQYYRMISNVR